MTWQQQWAPGRPAQARACARPTPEMYAHALMFRRFQLHTWMLGQWAHLCIEIHSHSQQAQHTLLTCLMGPAHMHEHVEDALCCPSTHIHTHPPPQASRECPQTDSSDSRVWGKGSPGLGLPRIWMWGSQSCTACLAAQKGQ